MSHESSTKTQPNRLDAERNVNKISQEMLGVVENESIAENIYRMKLTGNMAKRMSQPGQFIHLRCADGFAPLLRRPLSICDVDQSASEMSIIYRLEGEGTRRLSAKQKGDVLDALGPLGRGFPINASGKGDRALIVGGGVGVPPLYYLSKQLVARGVQVTHVLGFGSRGASFLTDEFARLGKTYVTTLDGSLGTKGMVTHVLDSLPLNSWKTVFACGPVPMLRALSDRFCSRNAPQPAPEVFLSLEERMGCGIGACFACVCRTPHSDTDYRKVCADGPVFKLGEVII